MPAPDNSVTPKTLLRFYRSFLRNALRAVNYKPPQKYIVAAELRARFEPSSTGNSQLPSISALKNTDVFLRNAALYTGLESKLVDNMAHIKWAAKSSTSNPKTRATALKSISSYTMLVDSLNKEFDLCL